MRRALLFVFLFAIAVPAQAGPHPIAWAKHHKRFLVMESAALGSAAVNVAGFQHCHRGDVEQCIGKYGSGKAIVTVGVVLTTVIFPAITEGCWKNVEDRDPPFFKHCGLLSGSASAVEFGFGIQQFTAYQKRIDEKKNDSTLVFRLRRRP